MGRQHGGRKPREQRLDEQLARRCACGKVYAETKSAAKRLHRHVAKGRHEHEDPVDFYECQFLAWHWTYRPRPARTTDPSRSTP